MTKMSINLWGECCMQVSFLSLVSWDCVVITTLIFGSHVTHGQQTSMCTRCKHATFRTDLVRVPHSSGRPCWWWTFSKNCPDLQKWYWGWKQLQHWTIRSGRVDHTCTQYPESALSIKSDLGRGRTVSTSRT